MNQPSAGSVVVGLDPSANAHTALLWAADEASARGADLRIGHSWTATTYQQAAESLGDVPGEGHEAAAFFLDPAAAEVRGTHPGLVVETAVFDEPPVEGLLRMAAAGASLIVVGHRGLNPFSTVLMGSVSQGVVAHTTVPAVVVPPKFTVPGDAPVVVGVAPGAVAPVEFAFAEAELRGVPLVVVRAWMYPQSFPGHISVPPADETRRNTEEAAELESLIAPAWQLHPGVEVTTRIGLAIPEQALVDAASRACLVVVGAHRKHSRFGLPVGRVPHRVLHHAQVPVAVVPHD